MAIEVQLELRPGQTRAFYFPEQQYGQDAGKLTKADIARLEKQAADDRRHMEHRLEAIDREIKEEPEDLKSLYQVSLRRLQPVGLVVLWPRTRG